MIKATIKSTLSEKEDTKKEGEELLLPDFPGIKATIEKITPADANGEGSVEISFSEPGKPKGKAQLKLTK